MWVKARNLPMKLTILRKLANHVGGVSSYKLSQELTLEFRKYVAEPTVRRHLQWLEKHGSVVKQNSKWKLLKTTPVLCIDKTVIVKYPTPFIMGCPHSNRCLPEANFPNCEFGSETAKKGLLEFAVSIPLKEKEAQA